ncbi:molybdopterin-dependent oxidoreductase [Vibrio lentus]|nr:molybdopterin-dependent oxidoreductase [Vibrio lentus]
MRRRVYNPDRLKYPMKRVGKRGEGKFGAISWEAYDEVAVAHATPYRDFGNDTIYLNYGTRYAGAVTNRRNWRVIV